MPQKAVDAGGGIGAGAPRRQPASVITLLLSVTAPVDASRRPSTVAPVLAVIDAYA